MLRVLRAMILWDLNRNRPGRRPREKRTWSSGITGIANAIGYCLGILMLFPFMAVVFILRPFEKRLRSLENYVYGSYNGIGPVEVPRPRVPIGAEKILYFLLPAHLRHVVPGCLEEEFLTVILPKFGERYAKWWYRKQVLTSVWPILKGNVIRIVSFGLSRISGGPG